MGESRQELVNWVNGLLQLEISRVEQCGSGAVYCQIYDTVFGDVPLSKVRFDATSEYQYLQNFKVLQSVFTKHKVDRAFDAEKLAKCRLQDNLEFLQWTRRFWESNYDGQPYDAVARRRGVTVPRAASVTSGGRSSRMVSSSSTATNTTSSSTATRYSSAASASSRTSNGTAAPARPVSRSVSRTTNTTTGGGGVRIGAGRSSLAPTNRTVTQLQEKNRELMEENQALAEASELVETERDFYFQKLRDIEILIQTAADQLELEQQQQGDENANEGNVNVQNDEPNDLNGGDIATSLSKLSVSTKYEQLIKEIQTILYSTAEGFEIPDPNEAAFDEEDEF